MKIPKNVPHASGIHLAIIVARFFILTAFLVILGALMSHGEPDRIRGTAIFFACLIAGSFIIGYFIGRSSIKDNIDYLKKKKKQFLQQIQKIETQDLQIQSELKERISKELLNKTLLRRIKLEKAVEDINRLIFQLSEAQT